MELNSIIDEIEKLLVKMFVRTNGGLETAPPHILSESALKIRTLLLQMVTKVSELELDYRRTKAARFDTLLKEGMKRSPAIDQLEFDLELIEKKIAVERVKNYMKYADNLVTAAQTDVKTQIFNSGL